MEIRVMEIRGASHSIDPKGGFPARWMEGRIFFCSVAVRAWDLRPDV